MVLVQKIEKDGATVLVFEGNDEGKTVETLVAEVICRLARPDVGVSSWAIHFASMHHPFSTTQRLREMGDKFMARARTEAKPDGYLGEIPYFKDIWDYRFVKAENKYYFSREFVEWVRMEYVGK